jgi:hypothetical protein
MFGGIVSVVAHGNVSFLAPELAEHICDKFCSSGRFSLVQQDWSGLVCFVQMNRGVLLPRPWYRGHLRCLPA